MKAKDLIVVLAELDPETDIQICACMFCAGSNSGDIQVRKQRVTNWDHKAKQVVTKVVTILEAD